MNIVLDVLLELVGGAGEVSSERGLVGMFTAASAMLLTISVWILLTSAAPLREAVWGCADTLDAIVEQVGQRAGVVWLNRSSQACR